MGIFTQNHKGIYFKTSSSSIQYTNGGSEVMTFLSSGNVGIGTTSPGAKLHVNSENSQGTLIISRGGNNLAATNNVGSITFPADYNGTPINYAEIKAYANALSGVRGSLDFNVKSTSGTVLTGMTVYGTSSGVNVGIGTTSPDAKLDVNGAGNFTGGTVVSGIDTHTDVGVAIAKGKFLKSNDGNYLRNIIGQTSGGIIEIGQSGTGLISDINLKPGSSGNINFYGSGGLDMRIASTGNVGIGTTTPTADLHIQGSSATDVPILRVGGFGDSGSKLELAETLTSGAMNYGFSFFNDGNSSNTLIIKAHQQ
jgi:hypothetical protein